MEPDPGQHAVAFLRTLATARSKSTSGAWAQAARLWQQVVEANPVEGNFWASLGNAHYQAGDYRSAVDPLRRAIELGTGDGTIFEADYYDPFPFQAAYRIACCYARLGDHDQALSWLDKSFEMGYRDPRSADQEADVWAAFREDPRYREIVGLTPSDDVTREEGWRSDLELLLRHVKRKAYDPFRLHPESDFDRIVSEASRRVSDLSDAHIVVEMMKLLALLGDGHAGIDMARERGDLRQGIPVLLYLFQEGLFIISATPEHEDLLGARVLRFGGRDVEETLGALLPILSRDNDHGPRSTAPSTLRLLPIVHALGLVPEPDHVSLELVDRHATERTVTLDAGDDPKDRVTRICPAGWVSLPDTVPSALPLYLKNLALAYWFEYLPESATVYFQFNSVRDEIEAFGRFLERLFGFIDQHEVTRLVIDMRWNGGGNTFLEIPLIHRLIASTKINRAGGLWVIIGRHTFSAAQNAVTLMQTHTEAKFVGEPTGSRPNFIGETIPVRLPYSRLWVNVSDLFWQTSWPVDYRTWIAPLIYAPPSFELFRQNRDPAMEAIAEVTEYLPGW